MSLRDWMKTVPRPRQVARQVGRRGLGVAAGAGRAALERLDRRLPERLREVMPEVALEVAGSRFTVKGLRISRAPQVGDQPDATAEGAEDQAESAAPLKGSETSPSPDSFFSSLPRGVRLADAEDAPRDDSLPRATDDVRALVQRMRDTLDNLDDVADYDVVGAVDDDLYQLWRELERKMQKHRQSEAKHQLKGMFSI